MAKGYEAFRNAFCLLPALARFDATATVAEASAITMEYRQGVRLGIRDGTTLAASLYRPGGEGRFPTLVSITPYGRSDLHLVASRYVDQGYAFIAVDSRGRFDSDGNWDPFDALHRSDGYDIVEWAAVQPWSTGKIGMAGHSYLGWTQWWTASEAPPHLVAIAPLSAPPDGFAHAPYQDGTLMGGWFVDWVATMAGRTNQLYASGPYGGWASRRARDLRNLPFIDLNRHRGVEGALWWDRWYRANRSCDPYWKAISYQTPERYARVGVPSLSVTGWFDVVHAGSPANYMAMRRLGATPSARRPSLVIGPWTHDLGGQVVAGVDYGSSADIDLERLVMRWFDRHVKGLENGADTEPAVRVFLMGANEWRGYEDWPVPGTRFTPFYLCAGKDGAGFGALVCTAGEGGERSYRYDPFDPTPDCSTAAEEPSGALDGAVDIGFSASRPDVLVYETAPMAEPMEVIGPIEATIYAATSAEDTDWMVRLVDVYPDGRALLIADGAMRARSRDGNSGYANSDRLSQIIPGQPHIYRIRFWRGTANRFLAGHRVRVEISSSWYPYYLPNLNSGDDNLALVSANRATVARQTIFHGARHPSHILLPLAPASPDADAAAAPVFS